MLPRLPVSTFEVTIPSTKQKMRFARMRVPDEKVLLTAKESGDINDVLAAIKEVIIRTAQDPTFDEKKLASFDIEYLFLKLHSNSVSNIVPISIKDPDDNETYNFDIDLNKVEVDFTNVKDPLVKVTDKIGIKLVYPSATLYGDKTLNQVDNKNVFIAKCVEMVYDGDSVIEAKNVPEKELVAWIESLELQVYSKIIDFLSNVPSLSHKIEYTNKLGTKREFTLRTLSDFFVL